MPFPMTSHRWTSAGHGGGDKTQVNVIGGVMPATAPEAVPVVNTVDGTGL